MNSKIKVHPKFILFQIIVVLHMTTRLVEASLPNKDIMNAVSCLKQFIGDGFLKESFRNEGLTLGEYTEVICREISEDDLEQKFGEKAKEDEEGTAIKECLAKINSEYLLDKYIELGRRLIAPEYETSSEQEDRPEGSETDQKVLHQYTSFDTTVVNFTKGICRSLIWFKPINFSQLTNENDKKDTLRCLEHCTSNFIFRIKYLLNDARNELIKSKIVKDDEEIKKLKNTPDSSMEFTTAKFSSELEKAEEEDLLNVDLISQVGKQYLISYSKLNHNIVKYISPEVKRSNFELGFLDDNLYDMYSTYQNCANLGCAMTSSSTPLTNLIKAGTDNDDSVVLQPFQNDAEEIKKYVSSNIETWRGFCTAFTVTSMKKD